MQRARTRIAKSLLSKGFRLEQGKKDHDYFWLYHRGVQQQVFTKMSRGTRYREVRGNLLATMGDQLNLTLKQFLRLVDCDMEEPEYLGELRSQGLLRE